MTKGCKSYIEILRLSKTDINRLQNIKSVDLHDFIERFSYNLELSQKDTAIIIKLASLCQDLQITNDNTPPSMASGCIYLYIQHKQILKNKKDISDICKISEVTINKCYKKLESNPHIQEFLKTIKVNKF